MCWTTVAPTIPSARTAVLAVEVNTGDILECLKSSGKIALMAACSRFLQANANKNGGSDAEIA